MTPEKWDQGYLCAPIVHPEGRAVNMLLINFLVSLHYNIVPTELVVMGEHKDQ